MSGVIAALSRRKTISDVLSEVEDGDAHGSLKKCLSRWDVVAYGVSSTVGAGIFVITGSAVVLSFIIASICCLCSAFCYAEFAAKVPVSGSAYTFTYVCMGEFAAWFVIGINFPLWLDSYDIGFTEVSPMSLVICLLCTGALLVGAKESALLNKSITILNITCILFIIILGSVHIDTSNWTTSSIVPVNGTDITVDLAPSACEGSHTGFVPCGFNGILLGAVKIFFSYIGFDSVTTLSEEVSNPRKDIPFGVMATLFIAGTLYICTSLVLTGMQPWFLLDTSTPLASAFSSVGADWAATLIAACTVTALSVTALCSLFGQPRIFYRMAKDGLLFPAFASLTKGSKVPLWGTIFSGVCAGLISFFLDINILADMISMGTLLAFTTVCAGIVLLNVTDPVRVYGVHSRLIAFIILVCGLSVGLRFIDSVPVWVVAILGAAVLVPVVMLGLLPRHPRDPKLYTAPLVPYLPLLGIFCNVYLICSNTPLSFYRLIVWTFVGCSLYFVYGISHSKIRPADKMVNDSSLQSLLRNAE